jgi:hypothetical protein
MYQVGDAIKYSDGRTLGNISKAIQDMAKAVVNSTDRTERTERNKYFQFDNDFKLQPLPIESPPKWHLEGGIGFDVRTYTKSFSGKVSNSREYDLLVVQHEDVTTLTINKNMYFKNLFIAAGIGINEHLDFVYQIAGGIAYEDGTVEFIYTDLGNGTHDEVFSLGFKKSLRSLKRSCQTLKF